MICLEPDNSAAAELNARGVCVVRGTGQHAYEACLEKVTGVLLPRMLALPSDRPGDGRHFLRFVRESDGAAMTRTRQVKRLEAFYDAHPPAKPKTFAQLQRLASQQPWDVVCGKLREKYGSDPDELAEAQEPQHQSDFVPPFCSTVEAAVRAALTGNAGDILIAALGRDAELCELTTITSDPGTPGQYLHADACWSVAAPRLITVFLALHDIVDEALGPTRYCLNTHAPHCFHDGEWLAPPDDYSRLDPRAGERLAESPPTWFALEAGDAVLMDSTAWHCGGANTSKSRRTLMAISFVEVIADQDQKLGGVSARSTGRLRLSDLVS